MTQEPSIAIMIHDLKSVEGHSSSMLEIAKRLNKKFPLEIHSYTLEDDPDWGNIQHIPYENRMSGSKILKSLNYHWSSWKKLRQSETRWVQSTGVSSFKCDVIHVPLINHTWARVKDKITPLSHQNLFSKAFDESVSSYKLYLEKKIFQNDKKFIAVSHAVKKELMEFFDISSENIEIIYYGVDSDHFIPWFGFEGKRQEIRQQMGLKESEFVLLQMDAFTPRRGLLQGLQVLSVLKKNKLDQVKLLAVGDGDQRLFERWVAKLDLKDRVIFESPKRSLRDYYWAADTLFFPSYYEPFGLYALEALSCQLPVVISQWAGCAELMKDHESALFIDPFSRPEKISNILLEVIKDPEKAKRLGENGRKVAENRSWDQVGFDYIRFYKDLNEKEPKE